MSWKKYFIIPKLLYCAIRAPRNQGQAWDHFWSGIRKTGIDGQVLWDAGSQAELDAVLERLRAHMDFSLPIVDLGCGSGRQSRALAAHFPMVFGFDVSPHAIDLARKETPEAGNISYAILDVTEPGAGRRIASEHGEANVYIRGVLHVLDEKRRAQAVDNLRDLVGKRGAIYLSETNIEGNPLDHLEFQGATPTYMPDPLKRCIEAGIKPPSHFGQPELRAFFPAAGWDVLASDKTFMHGVPLFPDRTIELIPSFFAVVRPRSTA